MKEPFNRDSRYNEFLFQQHVPISRHWINIKFILFWLASFSHTYAGVFPSFTIQKNVAWKILTQDFHEHTINCFTFNVTQTDSNKAVISIVGPKQSKARWMRRIKALKKNKPKKMEKIANWWKSRRQIPSMPRSSLLAIIDLQRCWMESKHVENDEEIEVDLSLLCDFSTNFPSLRTISKSRSRKIWHLFRYTNTSSFTLFIHFSLFLSASGSSFFLLRCFIYF